VGLPGAIYAIIQILGSLGIIPIPEVIILPCFRRTRNDVGSQNRGNGGQGVHEQQQPGPHAQRTGGLGSSEMHQASGAAELL
jgi:hypothetical protein